MSNKCPYCDGQMQEVDSKIVYGGKSYGPIMLCSNYPKCDARVGVRNGKPMGTPARHELRELRKQCHAKFDRLWLDGPMTREKAYRFLSFELGTPRHETHIARFNEEQCRKMLKLKMLQ